MIDAFKMLWIYAEQIGGKELAYWAAGTVVLLSLCIGWALLNRGRPEVQPLCGEWENNHARKT